MRVLLVHNHYGSAAPSGENRVFEIEAKLLRKKGHEVRTFERFSDSIRNRGAIGLLMGAATTPWNPAALARLKQKIQIFRPEVIHYHNTFPILSPSVFYIDSPAARVLTLHNYRLFCPAAIPLRRGKICTDCITRKSSIPSIVHGCYRDSRIATLPLAASVSAHRKLGTWSNQVEAFIALTEFQRKLMIDGGLPGERVLVKPNHFPGTPSRIEFSERPPRVVYAGRLSEEKGVNHLVEAWLNWGAASPELRIIGDGPLFETLKTRAAECQNISFTGLISSDEAEHEIKQARLLVLPSVWFEGFPMVLREAFAFGIPVAVSNVGPLPGIVKDAGGITFEPHNPKHLLEQVSVAWKDQTSLRARALKSIQIFEEKYNEISGYNSLIDIYHKALGNKNDQNSCIK